MKTFLASSIPNLVTQDAVFEAAFLSQECCTDCGFLVCLKFVRDKTKDYRRFANSGLTYRRESVLIRWQGRARAEGIRSQFDSKCE